MEKECNTIYHNVNIEMEDEPGQEDRYLTAVQNAQDLGVIHHVMIQTVTLQMTFKAMMAGLERGDYIIPDFQRMYRWSERQVEELAISLLRGMPIPPIYGYRNRENQIIILDGQQRMLSLYFYYIGKYLSQKKDSLIDVKKETDQNEGFRKRLENYGLADKTYYMEYQLEDGTTKKEDITYQHFSERIKHKINCSTIVLIEINVDSEKHKAQILHKIFANLNIGGTPLSNQQLRNGIYGCMFYHMLYEINDHSLKWRAIYSGNASAKVNRESKDVELLLTMCAFKYFVKGNGKELSLTGYRGTIALLLDDFSEKAIGFSEQEIAEYREGLITFFDSIEVCANQKKDLALASIFVIWERMDHRPLITKQKYQELIACQEYCSTIKSTIFQKDAIEERLKSVYEQLSGYDA